MKEKITIESTDGKKAIVYKGQRRIGSADIQPWPAKKGRGIVHLWDFSTIKARAYLAASNWDEAKSVPYGKGWSKTYTVQKQHVEHWETIYKQREEWKKKCSKPNITVDMPRGTYVLIDPCYLPEKPKTAEQLGTVWEAERLENGGLQFRTFGDGHRVDSGTLAIIPAKYAEEYIEDQEKAEKYTYAILRGLTQVTFGSVRRLDKETRIYRRKLKVKFTASRINSGSGGLWYRHDFLPIDSSVQP